MHNELYFSDSFVTDSIINIESDVILMSLQIYSFQHRFKVIHVEILKWNK